jgi:hypothetical protein
MRWKFSTLDTEYGVTVVLKYESAMSRSVTLDGEEIPYNQWVRYNDPNQEDGYSPILQEFCGENRFIGVENILEFYLDGTCDLGIQPRDAIQTKVRMEWTMDEFFDSGGTTAFIDRLCGSLGIHASTVKIVGVAEGSVEVNYEITPTDDEPMSIAEIQAIQTEQFATGAIDLGAPILDVTGNGEAIVADGVSVAAGFSGTVLVRTSTNAGWLLWYDWIEPWCWWMAQVAAVDTPTQIVWQFASGGLVWFWNELAMEVETLAASDFKDAEQTAFIEDHTPIIAPDEVNENNPNFDGPTDSVNDGLDGTHL